MRRLAASGLLLLFGSISVGAQEDPGQVLRQALAMAAENRFDEAIGLLEPLAAAAEAQPLVIGALGALYVEAGRHGEALETLKPLIDRGPADPAALFNAGRAALALGLTNEGVGYLERSVAMQAGTPAARELGLIRARQGRFVDALLLLRDWARNQPDDTEARLAAALAAVQLQRAPEAEELLSDLPQDRPEVRLLWGKLLILRGEPEAAVATMRPLLGQGNDLDARRAMAEALTQLGDAAAAIELLEGRAGQDPAVGLLMAKAQYQAGDVTAALATLSPFLKVSPDVSAAWPEMLRGKLALDYGRLLVAAGRHQEALHHLEEATRLRADDKLGWQSLGQALAGTGRTEEARVALERFQALVNSEVPLAARQMKLERDVNEPAGMAINKALQLIGQERYEEALEEVRLETRLSPQDVRLPMLEARILLLLNLSAEAYAAAERALSMEPYDPDAHYQRGAVQMALRNLEAAEVDFRRALELAPDHTAAMSDLAVLLMVRGQNEQARQLLERILELRPDDGVAYRNLKALEARDSG